MEYLPTTEISPLLLPAGGLYSSAADLIGWRRLQLGQRPGPGASAPLDSAVAATRRPHVILGPLYQAIFAAPAPVVAYGHGWVLYSYRGQAVAEHGGTWDGYCAYAVLLPEKGVGFVILGNLSLGAALDEVRRLRLALIDALLAE